MILIKVKMRNQLINKFAQKKVNINLYLDDKSWTNLSIDTQNNIKNKSTDSFHPVSSPGITHSTAFDTNINSTALSKHLSRKINERSFNTNKKEVTSSISNMFGLPPSGQSSSKKQPILEK